MKKIFAILALALTSTAFAADYVTIDVDNVQGRKGASDSTAQFVRAGKGFGDYQLNLQSRTATVENGGMRNSFEATIANNKVGFAGVTPFVGVGHDNGFNGANGASYQYGLVGASYGLKAGPGYLLTGVKTRVGSTQDDRTKQTVTFATYSVPVAKNVSVRLNASRSSQDIKESALGLGLAFNF